MELFGCLVTGPHPLQVRGDRVYVGVSSRPASPGLQAGDLRGLSDGAACVAQASGAGGLQVEQFDPRPETTLAAGRGDLSADSSTRGLARVLRGLWLETMAAWRPLSAERTHAAGVGLLAGTAQLVSRLPSLRAQRTSQSRAIPTQAGASGLRTCSYLSSSSTSVICIEVGSRAQPGPHEAGASSSVNSALSQESAGGRRRAEPASAEAAPREEGQDRAWSPERQRHHALRCRTLDKACLDYQQLLAACFGVCRLHHGETWPSHSILHFTGCKSTLDIQPDAKFLFAPVYTRVTGACWWCCRTQWPATTTGCQACNNACVKTICGSAAGWTWTSSSSRPKLASSSKRGAAATELLLSVLQYVKQDGTKLPETVPETACTDNAILALIDMVNTGLREAGAMQEGGSWSSPEHSRKSTPRKRV